MIKKATMRPIEVLLRSREIRNKFAHNAKALVAELVNELRGCEQEMIWLTEKFNQSRKKRNTVFDIRWRTKVNLHGCRIVTPYLYRRNAEAARKKVSCGVIPLTKTARSELVVEEPLFEGVRFSGPELDRIDGISALASKHRRLQKALSNVVGALDDKPSFVKGSSRMSVLARVERDRTALANHIDLAAKAVAAELVEIEDEIDDLRYDFNHLRGGPGSNSYQTFKLYWNEPDKELSWPTTVTLFQVTGLNRRSGQKYYKKIGDVAKGSAQLLTEKTLKTAYYRGKARAGKTMYSKVKKLVERHQRKTTLLQQIQKIEGYLHD